MKFMNDKELEIIYGELKNKNPNYQCPHIYYEKEILTADTGDLICKNCKKTDFAIKFKEERQYKLDKMIEDFNNLKRVN